MKIENLKLKIVFFGASKFVIPLIDMLNRNFDLVLVVTTERDPSDVIPSFCKQNNIPHQTIKKITPEIQQRLEQLNAPLAVLAYFGVILPKQTLELFSQGILNIHPSLLPKYRGATPVQSALLNGDTETGVSIIKLDEEMDHGPILAQEKEKMLPSDTTASLHDRLFTKGTNMLQHIIPEYFTGRISPTEQNHEKAIYTKRSLTRQDGFIEVTNPPDKTKLDRMIRAYYPWPTVWTHLLINGKEKVVKLLPPPSSLRGVSETNDAAISSKILLQVEGKKPVSLKDFLNGYPEMRETIQKLFG